jgi:hypothetical protein
MNLDLGQWESPNSHPNTDRVVLIVREAMIGTGLRKDIGYFDEGVWYSEINGGLHNIIGWREYPDLPKIKH